MALLTFPNTDSVDMTDVDFSEIFEGDYFTFTSTEVVVGVNPDALLTFTGTGFDFDPITEEVISGTVNGLEGSEFGTTVFTLTGLSITATLLNPIFDAEDTAALLSLILGGNDTIAGTFSGDTLLGLDGADSIAGEGGADLLLGGEGADTLDGDTGNDTLLGEAGDDSLEGWGGRDSLNGGADDDILFGYGSHDTLGGGIGNDDLRGGYGRDLLNGSGGNDILRGFEGDDRLFGGGGNDTLLGNDDNDSLTGGGGADRLKGDAGDDTLNGRFGDDLVTGGTGDDLFEFRQGHGNDTYDDFTVGMGTEDVIELIAFGAAFDTFAEVLAAASQSGSDVVIDCGGGDSITIEDTTVAALHEDDFIFS